MTEAEKAYRKQLIDSIINDLEELAEKRKQKGVLSMGNTMTVTVNQKPVSVKEYKGQRVVTFKDVDTVHGRPEGTARKRFNDNRKHFIEGVDYYRIQPSEIRTVGITSPNGGIVVTESGYLMLAKSFTDDLSWKIQRELVNCYFNSKSEPCTQMTVDDYEYYDKTYRGEPVLSIADFAQMSGLTRHKVYTCILKEGQKNKDYYSLEHESLAEFKKENPRFPRASVRWYIVITRSGFEKLCKNYDIKVEKPQCFIGTKKKSKKEPFAAAYSPSDEMSDLMEKVRQKANQVQALSYLLSNVNLTAASRLHRGELRYAIMELNLMIDRIDSVRF